MIGLWARSTEVVYSVRSSSSELDIRAGTIRRLLGHFDMV